MINNYYECHITIDPYESKKFIKQKVEEESWTFSAIDGDPDLGQGIKCYATKHINTKLGIEFTLNALKDTAAALHRKGCKVLRRKIELVIFDDRNPL